MTIDELVQVLTRQMKIWETYAAMDCNAMERWSGVYPKPEAWTAGYATGYQNCADSIRFICEDNGIGVS